MTNAIEMIKTYLDTNKKITAVIHQVGIICNMMEMEADDVNNIDIITSLHNLHSAYKTLGIGDALDDAGNVKAGEV